METLFGIPMDGLAVAFLVIVGALLVLLAFLAVRNRVLFKMGLRNIGRRSGRSALIVAGLMLGTAIIAAAFTTGDTMTHTIRSTVIRSLGHIDQIVSVRGVVIGPGAFIQDPGEIEYFDEAHFQTVREAIIDEDVVDGVAPAIIEDVAVMNATAMQQEPRVTLFATDPEYIEGFGEITEVGGDTLALEDLGPGEIYLNEEAAEDLGAEPGHELHMFAADTLTEVTVSAVVDYDGTGADGPSLIMTLSAAQEVLNREGLIKHIIVTNVGDELSGADHTDEVMALLEPVVEPLGLEADPTKQDALESAEMAGDLFTTFFVTFGSFSILAGILLIFLIFVMLAEERRAEMGVSRAVGTQRSHLVQMFLYEGMAYDLIAAAIGVLVGVAAALGMVFILAAAFADFGLDIRHHVAPRSLIVAYMLGVLLTFIVVTASAWRVSVLNIVTAIRNLPAPAVRKGGRFGWVWGVLALVAGILLTFSGLSESQALPFHLGVSLLFLSTVPFLRRAGASDRLAFTVAGAALMVWWLMPWDWLPDMDTDLTIFILAGVMIVLGATWAVMYNSDLLLGLIMAVFGRIRWLAPVLKTAISYPLTSRFRTGVTLAMFTLVVFTLVVMATITEAFVNAFDDPESFAGNYDIRATTVAANPVPDMDAAIEAAPELDPADFEVTAAQSVLWSQQRQADTANEHEPYPLRGFDETFLTTNTYRFATMAEGYDSAEGVWQALADNPGLAIVDPLPVPRREEFGFAAGALIDFELEGFFIEDERFDPVEVEVQDPATGTEFTLTIIGVLRDTAPEFMTGVGTSLETLEQNLPGRAPPMVHFFRLDDGVDAGATADALEMAFSQNGMEADVLAELLADAVGANRTFNRILQGFMGLGLVVGVAALGVISARSVVERRHQIGVLRSIGFQASMVRFSFALESSFIALTGIFLGTAMGLLVSFNIIREAGQAASWEELSFTVPVLNLVIIFAIVYAGALLTTYLPARQASRVYPAEALRYE